MMRRYFKIYPKTRQILLGIGLFRINLSLTGFILTFGDPTVYILKPTKNHFPFFIKFNLFLRYWGFYIMKWSKDGVCYSQKEIVIWHTVALYNMIIEIKKKLAKWLCPELIDPEEMANLYYDYTKYFKFIGQIGFQETSFSGYNIHFPEYRDPKTGKLHLHSCHLKHWKEGESCVKNKEHDYSNEEKWLIEYKKNNKLTN